jgi:hypothetical protein
MAVRAVKRRDRIDGSAACKGDTGEALSTAMKDLIDNLIVPNLIDEFLLLYGAGSMAKQQAFKATNSRASSHSELNSTP